MTNGEQMFPAIGVAASSSSAGSWAREWVPGQPLEADRRGSGLNAPALGQAGRVAQASRGHAGQPGLLTALGTRVRLK